MNELRLKDWSATIGILRNEVRWESCIGSEIEEEVERAKETSEVLSVEPYESVSESLSLRD